MHLNKLMILRTIYSITIQAIHTINIISLDAADDKDGIDDDDDDDDVVVVVVVAINSAWFTNCDLSCLKFDTDCQIQSIYLVG